MFYIHGGATGKKKAIREIFEVSNDSEHSNSVNEPPEREDDAAKSRSQSRGRSRSQSRGRSRSRASHLTYDTVTNSDADTMSDTSNWSDREAEAEAEAEAEEVENHDYITTIGHTQFDDFHYRYQFIEDELDYDIEEFAEQHPEIKQYDILIYKINTMASLPFLEFLFYYDKSVCKLPYYKHSSKKHIRKECDGIMVRLFHGKYRYKGYIHDTHSNKCVLFYEKYFRKENHTSALLSLETTNWYWVTIREIIYHRKYMSLPIETEAVDFFIAYPMVGVLQATVQTAEAFMFKGRDHERFKTVHIEAPTILYYGSTYCYVENTALYGLKREPLISRFGPFYYFTTLEHAYYWACYHNASQRTEHIDKNAQAGILRYAVFTKRLKTVFRDDDYDVDMVKKFIDRKNIFETKINQYRQTQEKYRHDEYDSIYSYDYTWTSNYDTIYNGYYDKRRQIRPVWSVCNQHNFQLLSYYEVDTRNIPSTYNPAFSGYTIK